MVSETRRDLIILTVVGLLFFCSTLILSFVSPVFSSPDETANAFFAETFATQGKLFSFEPLNIVLGDVLFPRSVVSVAGRLLPVSFLGLPIIFGLLIKIFGSWSLPIWTPLVSVAAVFAWYTITRRLFDRRIGLLSVLILFFQPAWWYWTARPLMPNILFVSFLIFSVFFLLVKPIKFLKEKINWLDFVLAGIFLALALWIRTTEIFWLVPVIVLGLIILRKNIFWKPITLFFISVGLMMIPLWFFNNSLYGSPWQTGYNVTAEVATSTVSFVGEEASGRSPLRTIYDAVSDILPFGLHPWNILRNVSAYGLLMFWWSTILTVVGLFFAWPRKTNKDGRRNLRWFYLAALGFMSVGLGIVYGSWNVYDNPSVGVATIGNSYTRYWLPLFVLATPFIAIVLSKFGDLFKKFRTAVLIICLLVLFGLGFYSTFFAYDDSLFPTRQNLIEFTKTREKLLELIEPEAVVIVDRADKLLFPDRKVRYPLRDETTYNLMPEILKQTKLYYFGITFPQTDLDYLNNEKLKSLGLKIEPVEVFEVETLYRIIFAE